MGTNYLSIENLYKTWHDRPVLEGISFGIDKGEKVALVAGNGQGKSTLLSIICGKETPRFRAIHHPKRYCHGVFAPGARA